jgi:hypothetical protein
MNQAFFFDISASAPAPSAGKALPADLSVQAEFASAGHFVKGGAVADHAMGVRHFRSVSPVFLSGFAILWNMLGSYFSQGPPGGDPEERF